MSMNLIAAFLLASLLVVISPGPATLYVARRCSGPISQPIHAVAGIVIGDIILITLSGIGVATLVLRFPELAAALKLGGAGYVAWVGVNMLRPSLGDEPAAQVRGSSFAGALLLTLSNPKAILFFAAFFPLFMSNSTPVAGQLIWLGTMFEAVNLAFYALFIMGVRAIWSSQSGFRYSGIVRSVCGTGLILAALVAGVLTLSA